jgi:hypothetical protein
MKQAVRAAHEHHWFQVPPTRLELPAAYPHRSLRTVSSDTHDGGRLVQLCAGVIFRDLKNEQQSQRDSNTLSPHVSFLAGAQRGFRQLHDGDVEC